VSSTLLTSDDPLTETHVADVCMIRQMTNVTRDWSNEVNTALVYYLVQHVTDYESSLNTDVNDSLTLTAAEDTCQLMMTVARQQAAIMLGHVIVSQCQGYCFM